MDTLEYLFAILKEKGNLEYSILFSPESDLTTVAVWYNMRMEYDSLRRNKEEWKMF